MPKRHNLPDNTQPNGDICIPVIVPNDPQWIALFHRAIRTLTFDRTYERDNVGGLDALAVRDRWLTTTYFPLIETIANGEFCTNNVESTCFDVLSYSNCITYHPNDPYIFTNTQADYDSVGIWSSWDNEVQKLPDWIQNLITFFGDITNLDSIGYGFGDIFVTSPPASGGWAGGLQDLINFIENTLSFNYPHVSLDLRGTGTVEIDLLSIPSGGSAFIVVNDALSITNILNAILTQDLSVLSSVISVELQRDIAQFPPETYPLQRIPVILTGTPETAQNIKIYFIPRFDDQFTSPIGLGGGFRKFNVCGDLTVICPNGQEITTQKARNTVYFSGSVLVNESEDVCPDIDPCIDNNSTVQSNSSGLQQVQESVQDIEQTTPKNTYAPAPDSIAEPDAYCGVAWYIANQLNDYIQGVITDAQTITLTEFLQTLLPIGGFEQTLLVQLWNFVVANANPNLATECQNAIPYVAEAFYCSNLSPEGAIIEINADTNITTDAKSAYVASINSWLDNKFAIATAIGQSDLSQDCSGFSCPWSHTFDFTIDAQGWTDGNHAWKGFYNSGIGWTYLDRCADIGGGALECRRSGWLQITFPAAATVTNFSVTMINASNGNNAPANNNRAWFNGVQVYNGSIGSYSVTVNTSGNSIWLYPNIDVENNLGALDGNYTITSVTINGTGVNPFA